MKAKLLAPIESIQGKLAPGYYARVLYGKQIIQRCPVRTKPPTEKQLLARKNFVEKYRKTPKKLSHISVTAFETTSLPLTTSEQHCLTLKTP